MKATKLLPLGLLLAVGCGVEETSNHAYPNAQCSFVVYGSCIVDHSNEWNKDRIKEVVDITIQLAPEIDAPKIKPAFESLYLEILDSDRLFTQSDGMVIVGSTLDDHIIISNRPCPQFPSEGVLAHEIGHLIGYGGHSYYPWFGSDRHLLENKVADYFCGTNKSTKE